MNSNSAVVTVTGAQPATPVKAPAKPRIISKQSRQFQQYAAAWNALSGTDQSSWQTLAQIIADPIVVGAAAKTNAYSVFITHAAAMNATGSPLPTAAPAHIPAPRLPALSLGAGFNTALSLSLSAAAPYPATLLLYAARPSLAGRPIYVNTPFRLLGSLPSLSGMADISSLFSAKFRVKNAGLQIALKIIGVSAHGFQTSPAYVTAIVVPVPGDAPEAAKLILGK